MSEDQVLVARTQVLARQDDLLSSALEGQGQICFVSGEAGAGMSIQVMDSALRAQAQHDDLGVALNALRRVDRHGRPLSPGLRGAGVAHRLPGGQTDAGSPSRAPHPPRCKAQTTPGPLFRFPRMPIYLVRPDTQKLVSTATIGNVSRTIRVPIREDTLPKYRAPTDRSFIVAIAHGDLSRP